MTGKQAMTLAVLALLALGPATARAQCTKDTDCKGNRICSGGECVDGGGPAPVVAPRAAATPRAVREGPLSFFQKGYASVAVPFSFHGWGASVETIEGRDYDSDLESDFAAGFRLAGYAALSESFHIGGAWLVLKTEIEVDPDAGDDYDVEMVMNMLGLALKAGFRPAERIWLGGALDIGVLFCKGELEIPFGSDLEMKTMAGLALFPRLDLDVLLVDTGAFRLAFQASLGLLVSPIAGGHPYDNNDFDDYLDDLGLDGDEIDVRFWWLSPVLMLGLAAGG
jgi:hypothetical protein